MCVSSPLFFLQNISAPFITQVPPFKKVLMDALPYVDFLFSNEIEAIAFAESEGWATKDLHEIARKVGAAPGRIACSISVASGKPLQVLKFSWGPRAAPMALIW